MAFPPKLTFQLPPDLRGQLWVAAGVPIGLAVLARAMAELELAVHRRVDRLAELDAAIASRTAELAGLAVPLFGRRAVDDADIAAAADKQARAEAPALDECGAPFPCAHRAHNPDENHPFAADLEASSAPSS